MGEEEDNEPPQRQSSPSPSPPTPTLKTDPEDELSKDHKEEEENHSEEETKQQIQDEEDEDDDEEEEEEDRPLLDMMSVDFPPPLSTLPPTPPLPSSPSPTDTEQQDSDEDDGPPPGWDHFKQHSEQVVTLATAASAVSLDIQTEDVRRGEEGEPHLHVHPCLPPEEVAPSVEEHDSEDDGPPPGWDSKCQPESSLQETPQSDMKMEDVLPDIQTEEGQPTPEVPSVDSEDEGPPPGWDSKCQPETKSQNTPQSDLSDIKTNYVHEDAQNENGLQSRSSPATQLVPSVTVSDMKMEDVQQDAHSKEGQPRPEVPSVDPEVSEDEGPPPGWDSKCQPEPKLETTPQSDSSDTKTNNVHENAQNENGFQLQSQSQSQSRSSPAPEPVSSDIYVEEQDLEDDGPPPGWNSKSELEPSLQMTCPTTPPSGFKIEEDKEVAIDKEVSSTVLGSTPQQQPHVPSSLPTPTIQPGTSYESNNAKNIEGSPQQFTRQRLIHPTKPQIYAPKPPMPINNYPEMGQMVCGSCRHLLSYPRGARYVECACCLEKNYVLEEHEVGQVICGGCKVLLMYPHGAPKVRCANCRTETEVEDQNRRPPLSEHKRRGRQHLKRVHAG